jgi:hypothetical protein
MSFKPEHKNESRYFEPIKAPVIASLGSEKGCDKEGIDCKKLQKVLDHGYWICVAE